MARTIHQARETDQTARARAMNENFRAMEQGLIDVVGGYATEREKALNRALEMRDAGYDVTPDDVYDQTRMNLPLQESFGVPKSDFRSLFEFRTPEYIETASKKRYQDMNEAQEKKEMARLNREYKEAQIAALKNKAQPQGQAVAGMTQDGQQPAQMPKLGADEKGKVGGIASAIRAINEMESSLDRGIGPEYIDVNTPFIGQFKSDTPFTKSQRVLNEVVGRLQSGGAISNDELNSFRGMGPRAGDSAEIQKSKIADQRAFLANKLRAYGVDERSLPSMGFDVGKYEPLQSTPTPSNFQSVGQQVPFAPMQDQSFMGDAQANMDMMLDPQRAAMRQSRIEQLRSKVK
jgi:hypothetical protein